jgi:ABC-2 type transport system permease protein
VRAVRAQLAAELRLVARQGEQLLVAIGIPMAILVFFSLVDVLPTGEGDPVDFLAPGVLALAVVSTSMVALGIGTGFERHYGVLRRLGTTPLGRGRWVAAKVLSVLVVEVAQLAVLLPVAALLGWSPDATGIAALSGALLLGTAAFAGLGLLLAGTLSGPANLAICNGLYVVLLLVGGFMIPLGELPSAMRSVAELLPAGALTGAVHDAAGGASAPATAWPSLAAWALALPLATARTFRWDPAR